MWLAKRRLGDSRRPCAPGMVEEPDVSGACAMAKQRTLTSISLLVAPSTQFCSHEWHGSKFKGPEKTAVGLINSINCVDRKALRFSWCRSFLGAQRLRDLMLRQMDGTTIPYHNHSRRLQCKLLHLVQPKVIPCDTTPSRKHANMRS
jgi:hypothetical protein